MARNSTKKVGALVELFRRKKKGLGIILEITDSKRIDEIFVSNFQELYRQNKLSRQTQQLFQCYNYYDKWPETGHVRKYIYVKWIRRPSEWETDEIMRDHDWYPSDLLRVVSSVNGA
tara:strand:+ start:93 stop:443 length:351 start_codon:yes stop_codon:yes gene_type:complete